VPPGLERRLLLLLLLAPLLGLIGVTAGEIVPDGRIGYHLLRAEKSGMLSAVERSPSPLGTTIDHFSECVALGIGLGDEPGQNIVSSALTSPTYSGCEPLMAALDGLEANDTLTPGTSYLRYWHGYGTVTRPAVGVLGVTGTRWLAFGLLAAVVVGMVAAVRRSLGRTAGALLLLPALLTTDMVIGGLTVQQAIGIATAWAGGWMAFAVTVRRPSWLAAALVAALAGALNAYVDLMTTIPGALALTAVGATAGALAAGPIAARDQAWRVTAAAVIGWTAGLVWMWSSKWVLATLAVGVDEVVDNVKSQIEFRISGEHEGTTGRRTGGLTDNLAEWWSRPLTPWVVVGLVAIFVIVVVRARVSRRPWVAAAACAAIVAVPVVGWYVVLNNHSQIHAWMVYRSLPLAAGGISALAYVLLGSPAASESLPEPDRADLQEHPPLRE
jgi:hypothetical protein